MKLVVGLGNPGERYRRTRHNVGFQAIEHFAEQLGHGRWSKHGEGLVQDVRLSGEKVKLLLPQTYMNRSGRSVRGVLDYFKIPVSELIVVCDDVDLPTGQLRIRPSGGSGGQRGLADVCKSVGSNEIARLRIGVGAPDRTRQETADYVLSPFSGSEATLIQSAMERTTQALRCWVQHGLQKAMNEYNRKWSSEEQPS